jgi:hypothetical protein
MAFILPPEAQTETRSRVMIVEDEALVAMMMEDFVEELGFSVCGPFSSLSAATVAAQIGGFEAAPAGWGQICPDMKSRGGTPALALSMVLGGPPR